MKFPRRSAFRCQWQLLDCAPALLHLHDGGRRADFEEEEEAARAIGEEIADRPQSRAAARARDSARRNSEHARRSP